jgi:hypothetical protein
MCSDQSIYLFIILGVLHNFQQLTKDEHCSFLSDPPPKKNGQLFVAFKKIYINRYPKVQTQSARLEGANIFISF